jgi:hypothetical protein
MISLNPFDNCSATVFAAVRSFWSFYLAEEFSVHGKLFKNPNHDDGQFFLFCRFSATVCL